MTGLATAIATVATLGVLLTMSPPRRIDAGHVGPTSAASTVAGANRSARAATPVVRRTVLALWDSRATDSPRRTPVHMLAEMPLNHLGLMVRFHDIRTGLPPVESFDGVRGVLTWFTRDSLPDPAAYLRWLESVSARGLPVVVVGSLGAFADEDGQLTSLDQLNRAVERLGWRYESRWMTTTHGVEYRAADRHLVAFERSLPTVVPPYQLTHASGASVHTWLHVAHPERTDTDADVILLGPRGGFIAPGYAYFSDRTGDREFRQWYVNPFEFFRQAFSTDEVPKPDTTTVSGRRIYYSHIDGDGWRSLTQVEPYRTRYVIAARVVLDELIRTSTDLPVSVGAVAGDLDPAWAGTAESLAVARDIYAQPQVEAAIHTYGHPLDWTYFDPERRRKPAGRGSAESANDAEEPEFSGPDVVHLAAGQEPRTYTRQPFSLALEVDAAAAFVNRLLPPGKQVTVMQWPGDTRAFAAAIAQTRAAGLANINGGDTRFDPEYPSAAWVAPLANQAGAELQVYASASNENTYTNLWRGRFFGFSFLTRTVENTGAPRRLKPFNLYYHMYSGERLASLNAVRANLAYARSLPLAPIETSRFSRIVDGFYHVAFEPAGARAWRVLHRGALQTIRFDGTREAVDFERSRGVIGQRYDLGSLYVALDEAVESPVIVLKPAGAPIAAGALEPREPTPYLIESRWRVSGVKVADGTLRFTSQGYGAGESRWQWPYGSHAEVTWQASSGRAARVQVEADSSGRLDVRLPPMSAERVEITISARVGRVAR